MADTRGEKIEVHDLDHWHEIVGLPDCPDPYVELSTLRARIGELEQAVTKARDTFRHYGDLHAAKPDEVKAKRNYDLAVEMQRALSGEREG